VANNSEQRHRSGLSSGSLGGLWLIYGLMRLGMAFILMIYSRVATLMFGALLINVPNPYPLMGLFHFVYVAAIVMTIAASIFSLLAGAALLAARSSARIVAITASLLSICEVPFGVTLGTYTLIRFLR